MKSNELAERIGVTPPVVSAWENNRTGLPETPTVFKLAKALNCSVGELLQGVDEEYDSLELARHQHINDRLAELRNLLAQIEAAGTRDFIIEELHPQYTVHLMRLLGDISSMSLMTKQLWPGDSGEDFDPIRHGSAVSLTPQLGGGGDAAATRIRELEGQLADAGKTIREMRVAAKRLGTELGKQIALAEGFEARSHQSGGGSHR